MYLPKHFAETDIQAMHQLMREHPLATLVHLGPDGLQANHIPLHLADMAAGPGILQGHVALANPLWREIAETQEVLAIFHGPQAYISPSGYATKAEHGKVVPTWNYATVHAYGHLRLVEDPAWLRTQLETLTQDHESSRAHPWALEDAPADYIDKMMSAIKGIEITLTRLEGKWKASQNQPAINQASLVTALASESPAMARMVKARNSI